MVARTPPKQRKVLAPLDPVLLRETVKKVDKCMARLQELQYTVTVGNKVISGVSLSPRSTRGYLRTSLRCKQESLRIKNGTPRKSPKENFPATAGGEWRGMSLTAMLVGATVGEILQATQFAREIVEAVATKMKKSSGEDPKTPVTRKRNQTPNPEKTELRVRRKKEKQYKLQSIKSESDSPKLQRARSRINFKVSPPKVRELDKENNRYLANRVLHRNKPWAKKTVLFPNPLFHSMPSQQQKFCKTRSPVIARNKHPLFLSTPTSQQQKPSKTRSPVIARNKQTTPHKFFIKSPPSASKFQVKIRSPPVVSSFSPTRSTNLTHPLFHSTPTSQQQKPSKTRYKQTTTHKFLIKSPPSASKFQVKIRSPPVVASLSPTRPTTHLCKKPAKLSTTSKLRRSFSPSKLANRLMSPLKSRKLKNVQKCDGQMSGLKQRPTFVPTQFSTGRI